MTAKILKSIALFAQFVGCSWPATNAEQEGITSVDLVLTVEDIIGDNQTGVVAIHDS